MPRTWRLTCAYRGARLAGVHEAGPV